MRWSKEQSPCRHRWLGHHGHNLFQCSSSPTHCAGFHFLTVIFAAGLLKCAAVQYQSEMPTKVHEIHVFDSESASTICFVWSIMVRPNAVTLEEMSRHGRTPTVAPAGCWNEQLQSSKQWDGNLACETIHWVGRHLQGQPWQCLKTGDSRASAQIVNVSAASAVLDVPLSSIQHWLCQGIFRLRHGLESWDDTLEREVPLFWRKAQKNVKKTFGSCWLIFALTALIEGLLGTFSRSQQLFQNHWQQPTALWALQEVALQEKNGQISGSQASNRIGRKDPTATWSLRILFFGQIFDLPETSESGILSSLRVRVPALVSAMCNNRGCAPSWWKDTSILSAKCWTLLNHGVIILAAPSCRDAKSKVAMGCG